MAILLDVIVVAIIVITVLVCSKKGFIKSVFDMLQFAASVVAAIVFKGALASFIMTTTFYKNAYETILHKISEALKNVGSKIIDPSEIIDAFKTQNPDLVKFLESMGTSLEDTKLAVQSTANAENGKFAELAAQSIIEPVMESIAHIIAFIIIFIAAFILLEIAEHLLELVFDLPVLNTFNLAGGIIIGILCAILYASLFVAVTAPFVSNPEMLGGMWDAGVAEKTVVYSFIRDNNILSFLVR